MGWVAHSGCCLAVPCSGMDDVAVTAYAAGLLGEYLAQHWQDKLAAVSVAHMFEPSAGPSQDCSDAARTPARLTRWLPQRPCRLRWTRGEVWNASSCSPVPPCLPAGVAAARRAAAADAPPACRRPRLTGEPAWKPVVRCCLAQCRACFALPVQAAPPWTAALACPAVQLRV